MTYEELANRYVAAVMADLHTWTDEDLDEYRRWGEDLGDDPVLHSDVTGHELAEACDHEIAGRSMAAEDRASLTTMSGLLSAIATPEC